MGKIINLNSFLDQEQKAKKIKATKRKINTNSLSVIKATLSDQSGRVKGSPYRVLSIPSSKTLESLAMAILKSYDFDSDHMYGFYDNIKKWIKSTEIYTMDGEENPTGYVDEVSIGQVFDKPKKKMLFLFDYGDEWRFIVELKKEILSEGKVKLSTEIIESVGEAPPQYPDYEV